MAASECYIDITIGSTTHRVTVSHDERPCDAELQLDSAPVQTRVKLLPSGGGAHFFEVEGQPVILTIGKEGADSPWRYDCFVDGKSVLNAMPWSFDKLDYPALQRWARERRQGKGAYFAVNCAKGALIGCVIFLAVYVMSLFTSMQISWLHLLISVVPLVLLYAVFAPIEWKNNEKAFAQYSAFLEQAAGQPAAEQGAQPVQPVQAPETEPQAAGSSQPEEKEEPGNQA